VNGPQLAHDIAVNRGAFDFSSGARSAQLEREQSAFVLVNIVLWDAFPFLAAMIFLGVEILFAALTDPGASSSARLAMKAGSAANADSAAIVRTTLHAHGGS
jgi:hypothetical protein